MAACALLLLYFAQGLASSAEQSLVFDEPFHLTFGYLRWTHPEYALGSENGVFAQAVTSAPMAASPLAIPPDPTGDGMLLWRTYLYGPDKPSWVIVAARAMNLLLGVLLGAIVFVWSRALFGVLGGLLSLALFALCPTLLAHGSVATTDMAAALGFTAATYAMWRVSGHVTFRSLLLSTLAVAMLVITKMSFLVLLPMAAVLCVVRVLLREPIVVGAAPGRPVHRAGARALVLLAVFCAHVVVVVIVLWLTYDFAHLDGAGAAARRELLTAPGFSVASARGLQTAGLEWMASSGLFPQAFVEGLTTSMYLSSARAAFAAGHYSLQGWWWFFPYAFAIKTPLGTLFLLALAPLALAFGSARPRLSALTPLFLLVCVYGFISVTSHLNIGHRHLLPIYPPLYVLAGANALWWMHARKLGRALALAALCVLVLESLAIRPHYLAFFNALIGGPEHGHEQLTDSSVDWGQDLPALRDFLDAHAHEPKNAPVYLSYFGTADPKVHGIDVLRLPGYFDDRPAQQYALLGGTYAISATMLRGVYLTFPGPWAKPFEQLYQQARAEMARFEATAADPAARAALLRERGIAHFQEQAFGLEHLRFARLCAWLRHREPDHYVGYSILIFRLSDAEVRRAIEGPPAELLPQPIKLRMRTRNEAP